MKQHSTRMSAGQAKSLSGGRRKIIAANKIMWASKPEEARKAKAARNAYRRAVGLPEIE